MGYIWAIYYLYLLTYLLLPFPVGYPGNKLPGYGSPSHRASNKGWVGIGKHVIFEQNAPVSQKR